MVLSVMLGESKILLFLHRRAPSGKYILLINGSTYFILQEN